MGSDRDQVYGTGAPVDGRVASALERLSVAAERIADSLGVIAAPPPVARALSIKERETEILARIEQLQRELGVVSLHRRADIVEDRLKCAMDPESLPGEPSPTPARTVPMDAPPVPGLSSWAVPAFRHLAPRRGGPFDRAPSEIPVSVRRAPGVVAALTVEDLRLRELDPECPPPASAWIDRSE